MKLNKKELDILNIFKDVFISWNINESIFISGEEWCGGRIHFYEQSSLEITKNYIRAKICMNTIELDKYLEIFYNKNDRHIRSYEYTMQPKRISFKNIKSKFDI